MAAWLDCASDCRTKKDHDDMKSTLCSPEGFDMRLDARVRMEASLDPDLQYILESVERTCDDNEDHEVKRHAHYQKR